DISFAAVDLLAGVVSTAVLADRVRTTDRLGVNDSGGWFRIAPFGDAHLLAQSVMKVIKGPVGVPFCEVPVHRLPRGKVVRDLAPGTAGSRHVQDRVDDSPPRVSHWATRQTRDAARRWQQRLDQLPLSVREVGWVR